MSVPVWVPSSLRSIAKPQRVSFLEVTITGHQVQVRDSEIGETYLDTYVYAPDMFSLVVEFNANGVKSVEVQ